MTLFDLIFKSGGFLDERFKSLTYLERAELVRVNINSDDKEIFPFNLKEVLNKEGIYDTVLRADDVVRIYSIAEIEGATRYVSIEGHVKSPGRYELFEENMRINDLLFKSGGFDDPIHRSKTYLKRADLIRYENDKITQIIIPFNLEDVLTDINSNENLVLLPEDKIRVYSEEIFNTIQPITIQGIVRKPGQYKYKIDMTLQDIILEAGGFETNLPRYRVEVARIDPLNKSLNDFADVITFNIDEKFGLSATAKNISPKEENKKDLNKFLLNPYDLISVRADPYFSNQKQVMVSGAVLYR